MGNKLDQLPIFEVGARKIEHSENLWSCELFFCYGSVFPPTSVAGNTRTATHLCRDDGALDTANLATTWKAMPLRIRIATSPVVKIFEISPSSNWLKRDEIGYFIVIIILKYLDTRCNHGQKLGAAHESLAPEEHRYTLRPKDLCIIW